MYRRGAVIFCERCSCLIPRMKSATRSTVGKTELAKAWASATGRRLIRLQCYEGLDETKALYEWEYAKQMLYTQLLRDKLHDMLAGTRSLAEAADRLAAEEDVFFS